MEGIREEIEWYDGRKIIIETGLLARQADGAAMVKVGDTMIFATAVAKDEPVEGVDFMPLTVEYQEKYASTGRFPGGFIKRETKPSEHEILIARLVDRALRPLFPEDFRAETQVLIYLVSADKNTPPDAYAALAASTALIVSDIPFTTPISEVRVAKINEKYVINPSFSELENATLDIIVGGNYDDINMVEGEMKEVSEEELLEALKIAHQAIKIQIEAQKRLAEKVDKARNKRTYHHVEQDEELKKQIEDYCYPKIYTISKQFISSKKERKKAFAAILDEFLLSIPEEIRESKKSLAARYFHDIQRKAMRDLILNEKVRIDGRKLDEIRPIWCAVDYLPSAHGSSLFTRGETQSLTTVTLGTKLDEQTIDGAVIEGSSKFILHYNFPPFSTGEVKPIRGTSRREIGHGNLAQRALKNMIVWDDDNPYTIRVVSDILESNGSSSMATVCAGSLALMDAGVKIKKAVAGIAMGLIMDNETNRYAILSDILGDEDHLGDMDFKVAGTVDGITACQMDIKIKGLSYQILAEALQQAKKGRLHILSIMNKVISAPREDYKPHAPRVVRIKIPRDMIGAVIGPGGKIIQDLQRETETTIVIEEQGDYGLVEIYATNRENMEKAKDEIQRIAAIPEIGKVYDAVVKSIQPYGVFVEILPGKAGLLHISEFDWKKVTNVRDYFNVGDKVKVKLIDIEEKTGKLKLSRKAILPKNQS
ncbi:MAG: polyribonucleotide nucleotidyltransferase [Bacteroidales bacterium]|nr:polyribonucleotide nucleotidyltransferase [Bacteroidales bacterium]